MVRAPTPPLLFIGMPKTSCMWWSAMLRQVPGARLIAGTHSPGCLLSQHQTKGMVVFGVLREPLDWYRSLWSHGLDAGAWRHDVLRAWGGGSLQFKDVLAGMTSGSMPAEVAAAPGVLWLADRRRRMKCRDGEGLWSWSMRYFFQGRDDRWLVDELVPIERGEQRAIEMGFVLLPPRNVTAERDHSKWPDGIKNVHTFTNKMRAQVEAADGAMLRDASRLVRAA